MRLTLSSYIQKGKVRLTVVSKTGKEPTIGILGEENFFGEGSLAGQGQTTPCSEPNRLVQHLPRSPHVHPFWIRLLQFVECPPNLSLLVPRLQLIRPKSVELRFHPFDDVRSAECL